MSTTHAEADAATSKADAGGYDRRWLALAVIAIAQLMVVLDSTIVNIALPSAQQALHISLANRQWVVTAYALAFGGLLLLGGRISDFMGRKRAFIIGLVGFGLASALAGAAQDQGWLFGARALQGAFGALMAPAALSLVSVTFTEPHERAKAFAVFGGVSGGGGAIGLILGGVLTEYASWRWTLFVNTPIAIAAAVAAVAVVHESKAEGEAHYDLPGVITSSLGLVALVYGFTKADSDGWASGSTVSLLIGSVVLLAVFVFIESRAPHPLLPIRVFTERNRAGSFIGSLLLGMTLFGMFLFLVYYLQGTQHYSAVKSGFAFLPFGGGIVAAAGGASVLLPRIGPRPLMVGGFISCALAMASFSLLKVDSGYALHILPGLILMSLGVGFAFVSMSSTALVGVHDDDAGVASALVNTTQQVGGSLGIALLNTIAASATATYIAHHGIAHANAGAVHGYTVAFLWELGALLLAAVVSVAMITTHQGSSSPDVETAFEHAEELGSIL
jgi:EmrB/QacA subfamily drug resistance transporter